MFGSGVRISTTYTKILLGISVTLLFIAVVTENKEVFIFGSAAGVAGGIRKVLA